MARGREQRENVRCDCRVFETSRESGHVLTVNLIYSTSQPVRIRTKTKGTKSEVYSGCVHLRLDAKYGARCKVLYIFIPYTYVCSRCNKLNQSVFHSRLVRAHCCLNSSLLPAEGQVADKPTSSPPTPNPLPH